MPSAAVAAASDFDNPASSDTSQKLTPAGHVQRQDTPNDPDYDIAETGGSTNLYDERFDLFGFPSKLTPLAVCKDGPNAGKPMVAGFNAAGAYKLERGNDGEGSIGVCPGCQYVPPRIWDTCVSDQTTFALGMIYATDLGAKVIEGADGGLYHSAFAEQGQPQLRNPRGSGLRGGRRGGGADCGDKRNPRARFTGRRIRRHKIVLAPLRAPGQAALVRAAPLPARQGHAALQAAHPLRAPSPQQPHPLPGSRR